MTQQGKSFWENFSTILGAITALIAALAGLLVAYKQVHDIPSLQQAPNQKPSASSETNATPSPAPNPNIVNIVKDNIFPKSSETLEIDKIQPSPQSFSVQNGEQSSLISKIKCQEKLRSPRSYQNITIDFVNRGDHEVNIYWIDEEGSRINVPSVDGLVIPLRSGQHRVQPSYANHIWMISDKNGRCEHVVAPSENNSVYEFQ